MKSQYWLLVGVLLFFSASLLGQSEQKELIEEQKRVSFIAIPLAFYLPETRFGFGAASNISLHWKNQSVDERPTQFTAGLAYTLNKQLLSYLSYNVYLPGEAMWWRGEIGYYDYVYPFYGIGQSRAEELSNFFARYPRFKMDALYQVLDDVFVGLSYRFDNYKITSVDNQQELFTNLDISAGITSGIGLASVVDTRDVINYPHKGILFDLVWQTNAGFTGATYTYSSLSTSFSKYIPIQDQVLALNFNSTHIFGDAPFYELALFGGGKRSRGYVEGEYRANNSFAIQAEYRFRFNKIKRLGGVAFLSAGQVFLDIKELGFDNTLPAIGAGVRYLISKEQNLNIRTDIGIGKNGLQFYVTFGEAF